MSSTSIEADRVTGFSSVQTQIFEKRIFPTGEDWHLSSYEPYGFNDIVYHSQTSTPMTLLIKNFSVEEKEIEAFFFREITRKNKSFLWYHRDIISRISQSLATSSYTGLSIELTEGQTYFINLRYAEGITAHIQLFINDDALIDNEGYFSVYRADDMVAFGEAKIDDLMKKIMEHIANGFLPR